MRIVGQGFSLPKSGVLKVIVIIGVSNHLQQKAMYSAIDWSFICHIYFMTSVLTHVYVVMDRGYCC